MKTALITGITGQDGSYLAEFLLSKKYEVHGLVRRASSTNTSRILHILDKIHIHYGDLSDSDTISPLMRTLQPDEVYNLGAMSHGGMSFDMPEYTGNVTGMGVTRLLEAIRKNSPDTKFYQASTSEMFGAATPPQNEHTPFHPTSPYSCAKLYGYWMVRNYRDGYGMFAVNGLLFNHESPRRGDAFVTRKITLAIANIIAGNQKFLELGNLSAYIDWGYAPEYVVAMWRMLQMETPADYVIGTGEPHTVQEFVDAAFDYARLDKTHLRISTGLIRPADKKVLCADSAYAREHIGWNPKITFDSLVKIMVDADLRKVKMESFWKGDGEIRKHFPDKWWEGD